MDLRINLIILLLLAPVVIHSTILPNSSFTTVVLAGFICELAVLLSLKKIVVTPVAFVVFANGLAMLLMNFLGGIATLEIAICNYKSDTHFVSR